MQYSELERTWLHVSSVEGMTTKRFVEAMGVFEQPEQIWYELDNPELAFLGEKVLTALSKANNDEYIDELLERMSRMDIFAITALSDDYPEMLKNITNSPPTLYIRGERALDLERGIAVVGSRSCTRDGMRAAEKIARELAENGVVIVSGLARGIDTYAHMGALNAGGRTIAVLGSGADVIYPSENTRLAERILESGGSIISEYPPGTQPKSIHFPNRNRLISGLCHGTLLVEGAKRSGGMITVNFALDQGRDVFVVPGSIFSPLSDTPNMLLMEGAMPVLSGWDILEHYRWAERPIGTKHKLADYILDPREDMLVRLMTTQEMTLNELRYAANMPTNEINSILTMLELKGIIEKVPGGAFRAYRK